MKPVRGKLLVRPIDSAERLPGGHIILTADTRERLTANQVEVIAVGEFALCDPEHGRAERKCTRPHIVIDGLRLHPHDVRAGDWVLLAPRSTIGGPDPERSEWFVHQDDVWAIFNSGDE